MQAIMRYTQCGLGELLEDALNIDGRSRGP
jgi:hypothetical protein